MSVHSGGVLLYRYQHGELQVMLVHPGGPFWANRDEGAWSIPKGVFEENESPIDAARREFKEETGFDVEGEFIELGKVKQRSNKMVHVWALEQDVDAAAARSNTFTIEWPKNSGQMREYPEVDRAQWFSLEEARRKILKGQAEFVDRLVRKLGMDPPRQQW